MAVKTQPPPGLTESPRLQMKSRRRRISVDMIRERSWATLFVLPMVGLLAIFRLWPLADAFNLSFKSWDGISDPVGIGWDNFRQMASDDTLRTSFFNNLKITLAIPVWVLAPFFIAQALHNRVRGWKFLRIAFFLPALLSPVVVGIYWGLVLKPRGPIDTAVSAVSSVSPDQDWLNVPGAAFLIVVLVLMWSTFGIGVLIYLAGLSTLDQEVLEAARVDGASTSQLQRHIVFWMMIPVIRLWTVLIFIAAYAGIFPLVFSLTRGGPGYSTSVLEFDIYQEAFSNGSLGYACAIGVALMCFVAVSIAAISWLLKDRD